MTRESSSDDRSERKTLLLVLLLLAVMVGGGAWYFGVGLSPKGEPRSGGSRNGSGSTLPLNADGAATDGAGSRGRKARGADEGNGSHDKAHDLVRKGGDDGRGAPRPGAHAETDSRGSRTARRGEMGKDGPAGFPRVRQVRREFLARSGFSYREVELRRQLLAAQSLADAGVAAAAPTVIELQRELASLHGVPLIVEETVRVERR